MTLLGKWIINADNWGYRHATEIIGTGEDCVFTPEGRVPNHLLPNYRLATPAEIGAASSKGRGKGHKRQESQRRAKQGHSCDVTNSEEGPSPVGDFAGDRGAER